MIWLQTFPFVFFLVSKCQATLSLQTSPIVQIPHFDRCHPQAYLASKPDSVWGEILFSFLHANPASGTFPNPQSWYLINYSINLSSYQLHYWISVRHGSATGCPQGTSLPAKWILVCLTFSYSHNAKAPLPCKETAEDKVHHLLVSLNTSF